MPPDKISGTSLPQPIQICHEDSPLPTNTDREPRHSLGLRSVNQSDSLRQPSTPAGLNRFSAHNRHALNSNASPFALSPKSDFLAYQPPYERSAENGKSLTHEKIASKTSDNLESLNGHFNMELALSSETNFSEETGYFSIEHYGMQIDNSVAPISDLFPELKVNNNNSPQDISLAHLHPSSSFVTHESMQEETLSATPPKLVQSALSIASPTKDINPTKNAEFIISYIENGWDREKIKTKLIEMAQSKGESLSMGGAGRQVERAISRTVYAAKLWHNNISNKSQANALLDSINSTKNSEFITSYIKDGLDRETIKIKLMEIAQSKGEKLSMEGAGRQVEYAISGTVYAVKLRHNNISNKSQPAALLGSINPTKNARFIASYIKEGLDKETIKTKLVEMAQNKGEKLNMGGAAKQVRCAIAKTVYAAKLRHNNISNQSQPTALLGSINPLKNAGFIVSYIEEGLDKNEIKTKLMEIAQNKGESLSMESAGRQVERAIAGTLYAVKLQHNNISNKSQSTTLS